MRSTFSLTDLFATADRITLAMTKLDLTPFFSNPSQEDWYALVEKALKGVSFEQALVSKSYDDLRIEPLYTRADDLESNRSAYPGYAPFTRGTHADLQIPNWDIRQLHCDQDPKAVSSAIHEDLQGGATSITIRIAAPGQFGLKVDKIEDLFEALKSVNLKSTPVSLEAGSHTHKLAHAFVEHWQKVNTSTQICRIAFNADPLGGLARTGSLPVSLEEAWAELASLTGLIQSNLPETRTIMVDGRPYHEAGASEAQEIACLAATLVAYLRALEDKGHTPEKAFQHFAFAVSTDADLFLTIVKLRAVRAIIYRILEASDAGEMMKKTHLTAQTSERMMARRDPYVNMLRTTVAAAGAALGGADAITVLPFTWALGQPDGFARRIARNTHIILQEESFLGHVLDPAGGSWYVEKMTEALSHKAWELFQNIEEEGGMALALQKGFVQHMIRQTREERAKAIAQASEALTGVSSFPDLLEEPQEVTPHPLSQPIEDEAITAEPLNAYRFSEPFEQLRDASDNTLKATGQKPQVFLANLGRLADFNMRATYAKNLFATGGIEAITNEGFETIEALVRAFSESDAKIACLCSSDKLYEDIGVKAAEALHKADADLVCFAGRPGETRSKLKEAGVGIFVHEGCDILKVLQEIHDILGIG